MSPIPIALASLLGGALGKRPAPAADPLESGDFEALLERASRGELRTGLDVSIDPDAGVELSDEQLGRLGAAVDRAQAAGALTAVVVLDGRALRVDVTERRVVGELAGGGEPLTGADTVVVAPGEGEDEGEGVIAGGAGDSSLLSRLSPIGRVAG